MKRRTPKIVSLFLCIIMLVGLLPTSIVGYAADTAEVKERINFAEVPNSTTLHGNYTEYGAVNPNWKYFDRSQELKDLADAGNVLGTTYSDLFYGGRFKVNTSQSGTTATDVWNAFKIKATLEPGEYELSFTLPEIWGGNEGGSAKMEMYFAPYDATKTSGADYMTAENCIMPKQGISTATTAAPNKFYVIGDEAEEKEYILVIKLYTAQFSITDISLNRVGDIPTTADFTFANTTNGETAFGNYAEYGTNNPNWKYFDRSQELKDLTAAGNPLGTTFAGYFWGKTFKVLTSRDGNTATDVWTAFKLKATLAPGEYELSFNITEVWSGNEGGTPKMELYFAPYNEAKQGGADYMTAANCIMPKEQISVATTAAPNKFIISGNDTEYVLIVKLYTAQFQVSDFKLTKTGELPDEYSYEISAAETEFPSPVNYGIYELALNAESGEDLSGVTAYLAPKTETNYKTEEYKIVSSAEGDVSVGEKVFVAEKNGKELLLYIDGAEKVSSVTLQKIESPTLTLSFEPSKLVEGKTATAVVKANGKEALPFGISLESSDATLAKVSDSLEIEAKKSGIVTITANVAGVGKTSASTKIATPDAEALPMSISASFGADVLEMGKEHELTIYDENGAPVTAGNIDITYDGYDESIISFNGVAFEGKKPGKTKIKVRAEMDGAFRECEVEVIVVGANLLTRKAANGKGEAVAHGSFENSIVPRVSENSYVKTNMNSFWFVDQGYKSGTRSFVFNYKTEKGPSPKYAGMMTNYFAVDFDWKHKADVETFHLIRMQTPTVAHDWKSGETPNAGHAGLIKANKNKIYQFSGYFKVDENSEAASDVLAYLRFNNDRENGILGNSNGEWQTSRVYVNNLSTATKNDKAKPGEWKYFKTDAVYANWDGLLEQLDGGEEDVMWLEPYFDIATSKSANVKYYLAEFAINEVAFDTVEFKAKGNFNVAKVYDTFTTTVVPYTSTGEVITSGATTKKFDVVYSTSNPRVAKIDASGVITAVSNGACEVYADMTIGDTTVRGVIPVEFSGLDIIFETVEGSITNDTLSSGESANVTQRFYNTDGTEYIDSPDSEEDNVRVYYESSDPLIAEVDQNGLVTAKAAGKAKISVYAEQGKILAKDEIEVTVSDDSPIGSVIINGNETLEEKFEMMLTVTAVTESGNTALLDSVEFDYADEESKQFIVLSENGKVKGLAAGTARVIAKAVSQNGSEMTSEPFEITVTSPNPTDKIIDFRVGVQAKGATEATYEHDGYTVNTPLTSDYLIADATSSKPNDFRWLPEGLFVNTTKSADRVGNTKAVDAAFNIKVDHDGWYAPSFLGSCVKYGAGRVEMFLNGEYLGYYDFYYPTLLNPGKSKALNPIYLRAGTDNVLVFRVAEVGGGVYMYLDALELKYLDEAPVIADSKLAAEKTTLAVGETSRIDTIATLSNGSEYEFGFMHGYTGNADYPDNKRNENAYVEYVSSDENVAKVVDGRIIAVAPGECTITSTAYFMGADGFNSNELEVIVTDEVLERIEVTPESSELLVGKGDVISVKAFLTDGGEVSQNDLTIKYVSSGGGAIVEPGTNKIYAAGAGESIITVSVTLNGVTLTREIPVTVIGEGFATVKLSAFSQIMRPNTSGYDISIECLDAQGEVMDATGAVVTYESSDENVVKVSQDGHMVPGQLGTAEITATVTLNGVTRVGKMNASVRAGKVERTYYTEDKIANARENAKKYEWAESEVKAVVKKADRYVDSIDALYEMIPSEGIPRSFATGLVSDPNAYMCRYCGTNLMAKYSGYPWAINAIKDPWKIKCPECARVFPSNDFGSFYELGKNEKGEFNLQYALDKHREKFLSQIEAEYGVIEEPGEEYTDSWYKYYGYGIEGGYLTNNLYTEIKDTDPVTGDKINGKIWGVDNGWGYFTGRKYDNGVAEVHTYIPVFVHSGLWATIGQNSRFEPAIYTAITSCAKAYLYTGDKKYARAGAILLDRIADFYLDYDLNPYHLIYQNSNQHGKQGGGKILGNIWEASILGPIYAVSYDAFFDIYEDEELLDYLTEKAIKYNQTEKLVDGQVSSEKLRSNVEKNILEEMLPAVKAGDITGNFGFFQDVLTKTAIVMDDSTLTPEYIQFVMQEGEESIGKQPCTGGNVFSQFMTRVDRDGFGDEASIAYNSIWPTSILAVAEDLLDYSRIRPEYVKEEYNLLANPKYIKMLQMYYPTAVSGAVHANIGDNSDTGRRDESSVATGNLSLEMAGYKATKLPLFAQMVYNSNGGTVKGLHDDIFTKNPETIQDEIEADIEEYGEIDFSKSQLLSGYGYASLISGDKYSEDKGSKNSNTLRTFWMYFGGGQGHRHTDRFNLGIDFYQLDMAPEMGYPEETGAAGANINPNWIGGTLSHNTVLVNETKQSTVARPSEADILHFDDAGDVKVMDADAPLTYRTITDIYRRTVLSIDIDDEASYAVDFFRIKGGDQHVYSFHSQSDEITLSDNIKLVKQPFGTYAGANIAYADNKNYTKASGYNYLEKVSRAENPGTGTFSADFKVEYLRIGTTGPKDLGLRFTMLNKFNVSEVATAFGKPPNKGNNPKEFEYLLVKREGKDLDTLFTSVIEPYKGEGKLANISRIDAARVDGKAIPESEPCEALKVEHKNGRIDYVVYAANKEREYIISDNGNELFRFRGFVGVYTVSADGEVAKIYLHDGVMLDDGKAYAIREDETLGRIRGKVSDFTKGNVFETFIDLKTDNEVDASELIGKIINVETDDTQNGVYRIVNAEKTADGYRISIGDVSLIRGIRELVTSGDIYIYNIEKGAEFEIPLTEYLTTAPEIATADGADEYRVSVGSMINVPIIASSQTNPELKYDLRGLPRGATFDEETMTISWKPTFTQLGENHVSLTVSDGTLSTTLHININVLGSVSGGGGGGGDTPSTDKPTDEPDEPTVEPDEPTVEPDEPGTDEPTEGGDVAVADGFVDLGNHAWAEDAINYLADEGIIKGTSETTFSPANNITRADYAILLVRAFELESDNAENFADVSASDYFARELAVARNTGIVGGIGDNKYAPRNTITRQDMMVILYRALVKMGIELKPIEGIEVEAFADYADVADYARDAVKALVEAGLVNGKGESLAGSEFTTRAEVAVLLKRVLDYIA